MNYDRPLSEDERGVLRDYVRRRGSGEPLQYITGEVAFRHITVKVRPGVLIPRPETEVLVSEVLAALPTPGPRDVAWNPEAAEQEREAVAAVKKALVEAGESVSPSENTESNETAEDVAVGGDFGRSSSAGMDETRKSLLVADLCTGIRLHRLLAGLRAPGCAGHRHGHRLRGGGARQGKRRGSGARRSCGRAAVLAGIRHRREAHGHLRRRGFQPALRAHRRHGRHPARGGRLRADARSGRGRRWARSVQASGRLGPPGP